MKESEDMDSVIVLMSTYNGEQFIDEQLKSIFSQRGVDVSLVVRDDGSTDRTIDILKRWRIDHPIDIIEGNNLGYAKSFMTLLCFAGKADYYAFADQDDIWLDDKLIYAIDLIKNEIKNFKEPSLYMSQATIVDINLRPVNARFHKRIIKVDSMIAHNFAIGCTMVFNAAMRDILATDIDRMELTAGHDYWCSCVAAAIGAKIIWDEEGRILYRQHGNNASGKIISIKQVWTALNKILIKWKNVRNSIVRHILINYNNYLSEETKKVLLLAANYKNNIKDYLKMVFSSSYTSNYLAADFIVKISIITGVF